jgi:RNA polymerase sigma-70 factor (ECF subfamily)
MTMMSGTDGELVRQALEGRTDAFAALVARYLRAAYAVALARTGDPHDAEDVAQDAFVVALERLAQCREPERFAGWFLEIVRNRALNWVRARAVRETAPLEAAAGAASDGGPEKDAERAALRGDLLAGLADLDPVRREVLLLHDLEGWKHGEIAERLGFAEGTARYHLHEARKAMRERLAARHASDGKRMTECAR